MKVNLNKYEYIIKLKDRVYKKVKDEVIAQVQGAKNNFIIANGSPITIGTPESNIKSLIDTIREELWY